MRFDARIAAVVLGCGWLATPAQADLVTYSFVGTDTVSGAAITGSLTYSTDAVLTSLNLNVGKSGFSDVGSLSITYAGHTYSSNSIDAILTKGSLNLYSVGSSTSGVELNLTRNGQSLLFSSLTSLPPRLPINDLANSTFFIGFYVPPPALGQAAPAFESITASGKITALDFVSVTEVAPEPGALTLGALGLSALMLGTLRRRRGAAKRVGIGV
jgi:MYXO-CTERM domain-containing protein